MSAPAELNFKNASGSGYGFWLLWLIITLMNAFNVFALVAGGLLAWRYFG